MSRVSIRGGLAARALFASVTAARASEAPDTRLGNDVVPLFQSIRLRLDADQADYSSATHTDLREVNATNVVRPHAEGSLT